MLPQISIDTIVSAILSVFTLFTNKTPKFKAHGGTIIENTALQNVQVSAEWLVITTDPV